MSQCSDFSSCPRGTLKMTHSSFLIRMGEHTFDGVVHVPVSAVRPLEAVSDAIIAVVLVSDPAVSS